MSQFFSPHHSKNLVFIGAGATAALGMPTTNDQTQIFRKMQKSEESKEELLKKYLKGDDLKKLGVSPGPALGEILTRAFDEVLKDPDKNDHEYLVNFAENIIKNGEMIRARKRSITNG